MRSEKTKYFAFLSFRKVSLKQKAAPRTSFYKRSLPRLNSLHKVTAMVLASIETRFLPHTPLDTAIPVATPTPPLEAPEETYAVYFVNLVLHIIDVTYPES
jgi:hypothetical protein